MRESDSIDDTTPLKTVSVSVLKKYNKKIEKSNHKEVCCCIIICIISFMFLMYICITFGQRNRDRSDYG